MYINYTVRNYVVYVTNSFTEQYLLHIFFLSYTIDTYTCDTLIRHVHFYTLYFNTILNIIYYLTLKILITSEYMYSSSVVPRYVISILFSLQFQ